MGALCDITETQKPLPLLRLLIAARGIATVQSERWVGRVSEFTFEKTFLQCRDQQVGLCLGMKTLKDVVIKEPFRRPAVPPPPPILG